MGVALPLPYRHVSMPRISRQICRPSHLSSFTQTLPGCPAPGLDAVKHCCPPRQGRGALHCVAHVGHHHDHAGHSHSHSSSSSSNGAHHHHLEEEQESHCHSHSHSHTHSHSHSHSCGGSCGGHGHAALPGHGHDHNHHDPANPVHRLLKAAFDATGLTALSEQLESSTAAAVAKVAGLLLAAVAAWLAGSAWLGTAAGPGAAAAAARVSGLATIAVYLLAAVPAGVDLAYDLTAGRIDTHVLMTLAALGTLLSGYAIEGALLLVLFQTSHALEHLLTHKAQGNLAALYDTIPTSAVLVELGEGGAPDLGSARRVVAAEVAVGAHMLVKPGEQVPLDGMITYGKAMVSAEHITGESLPVLVRPGDEVAAGSLNRDGLLVVRASRPAEESTPARIAKLTLDAQASRPRLRTWLDEFGEVYSKLVVGASLAALLVLLAMGVPLLGAGAERGAFYRAMGLLTVASPCALVMVPLAYVSAIAAIASRGILVKGGRVLDALSTCRTVAFDKTGTLTTGSLVCTALQRLHAGSTGSEGARQEAAAAPDSRGGEAAGRRRALLAAVALSQRSTHAVSEAVVLMGKREGVQAAGCSVVDFRLVAGGGVEGTVVSSSSSMENSSSNGSNGSSVISDRQHCWFGALDYVQQRLSDGELAAVKRAVAASGQARSSVLSVLVIEPAGSDSSMPDGWAAAPGMGKVMTAAGSRASSSSSSAGGGPGGRVLQAGAVRGAQRAQRGAAGGQQRSVWLFRFEDSVRQHSAAAVAALQEGSWAGGAPSLLRAVQVLMLTGDNPASAEKVARKLGIAQVHAALTPEQKLERVAQLKESKLGGGVIMVGDGINDAPALATADVGVAIASTATAAASAAADAIVLGSSGIAAVPFLMLVARDTQAVIRQNLVLAAASIIALVVPTVLGAVPLWLAVFVHEGSTLLVALNSLRPLRHAARLAGAGAGGAGFGEARAAPAEAAAAHAGSGTREGALRQAAAIVTTSPAL